MPLPVHMMTTPTLARQGDVLLLPIAPVADEHLGDLDIEGEGKRIVLAHGEVTGHAHAIYPAMDVREKIAEPAKAPRLFHLKNPTRFSKLPARVLRLETRALVRHEEHAPISVPPGDYLVIIQHEGDEYGELRRVAD